MRLVCDSRTVVCSSASSSVAAGTKVTLQVKATGAPPLSYQWQFNGVDLTNGSGARGFRSEERRVGKEWRAQAGSYSEGVNGKGGGLTSSYAGRTVMRVS